MNETLNHSSISKLYQNLKLQQTALSKIPLRDLFSNNPNRFQEFSLKACDILLDYSKQAITADTLKTLCEFAKLWALDKKREALFSGQAILNITEKREVLHTALRGSGPDPLFLQEKDLKKDIKVSIRNALQKLEQFSENLISGSWSPEPNIKITDILCLGIGGSELGPVLACEALLPYKTTDFRFHFLSNLDGFTLSSILKNIDPKSTLCIISSKSFTTPETLHNAIYVQNWFKEKLGSSSVLKHFVAVTANVDKALSFGIPSDQIFEFWDFVGGRYSIWSAVGLPLILSIGMKQFREFLQGAKDLDTHFMEAPFEKNMPVLLGFLSFWNSQFWGYGTQAILPYEDRLKLLPAYLQQLQMESNGKRVDLEGKILDQPSSRIIWGGVGCNGQHAFMQLLHQGTEIVPVDFLVATKGYSDFQEHQKLLLASVFSQSKALMEGDRRAADEESSAVNEQLDPFYVAKICPGNRPSSILMYPRLTPKILGSLLALYEHKVFVEGVLLNINSFDQWGVELGKKLNKDILKLMDKDLKENETDSSTYGLIKYLKKNS